MIVMLVVLIGLIGIIAYCLVLIPPYKGVVVMNILDGSLRSFGSGLRILLPWENIEENSETSLKKNTHSFEAEFKTKDESPIPLKVSFDVIPYAAYLVRYREFDEGTRIAGIKSRLQAILTILVRKKENRDHVMDNVEELAKELKKKFEESVSEDDILLEIYYGVNLKAVMISGMGLPEALKEMAVKQEVTEKENERRKSEMATLKRIARDLVRESKNEMPFQNAMEIVQLQFGKDVKKNIQIYGLDRGTQKTLEDISKNLSELLINRGGAK